MPLSHTFNCASLVSFRAPIGLDKSRNVSGLSRSTGDRKKKYCCSQVCQSRYSYKNCEFKTAKKCRSQVHILRSWARKQEATDYNTFSFLFEHLLDSNGPLTPRTARRAANRWQAEVDDLVNSKTITINKPSPLLLNAISTPWTNRVTVLSFLKALNIGVA